MNIRQLIHERLTAQQITAAKFKTPVSLVSWMGAMQAQDYEMAKWAIGIRLPGSNLTTIEKAIDKADIIRTHVLRPTWHFIVPADVHWMLALSAPNIKTAMRTRDKQLGLTEALIRKANLAMQKVLRDGNHLTREELMHHLMQKKIDANPERMTHFLVHAEVNALICSGKMKNKKATYALLDERVAAPEKIEKDEALGKLAQKYFQSHGPATLKDFTWWSGLSIKDSTKALDIMREEFSSAKLNDIVYWFSNKIEFSKVYKKPVFALPAFDEFVISYKNRDHLLSETMHSRAISSNGIFRPMIVIDGKVEGLWSRTFNKDKLIISCNYFDELNKSQQLRVTKSMKMFAGFLGKELSVIHHTASQKNN